ncbi:MAG: hypothetical protein ACT4OP_00645 [Actinomycetota bacterium]
MNRSSVLGFERVIPAHRKPGGHKFTFLSHEIFDWLISDRYEPE